MSRYVSKSDEKWSLWQDVSEDSQVSPSFDTPDELAVWILENECPRLAETPDVMTVMADAAKAYVVDEGWSVSFIMDERGTLRGIEFDIINHYHRLKDEVTA